MLRIKETTPGTYEIAITYNTTCSVEELDSCVADVKAEIGSSLDRLALNANGYDVVRVDNNGDLHCKKIATPDEPAEDDS